MTAKATPNTLGTRVELLKDGVTWFSGFSDQLDSVSGQSLHLDFSGFVTDSHFDGRFDGVLFSGITSLLGGSGDDKVTVDASQVTSIDLGDGVDA